MLCFAKAEQDGRKVMMVGPRRLLLPGLDHNHRADQMTQLCLQPMELVGIGKCTLLQVICDGPLHRPPMLCALTGSCMHLS